MIAQKRNDNDATVRSARGFTLVELMIVSVLLITIGGVIAGSMSGLSSMTVQGSVQNQLQHMGERALSEILNDLSRSGWVDRGERTFPYFFEDGVVTPPLLAHHAHAPPIRQALPGDPDYGPSREILFLLPRDDDRDNRPDILLFQGALAWDAQHYSYVLVPGANGSNVLERRIDGANPWPIAHFVERITFEDSEATSFQIPLKALRVRIWLRKTDTNGIVHRHRVETIVQLRNGGIQGASVQ